MSETWLPGVTRLDGPSHKQGYPAVSRRELGEIEGAVYHSVEGNTRAALGVLAGPRQASWHFTVALNETLQHYPLESICWHAGLPGDRRQDTSLIGNLALVGIEHSGGGPNNPGEPLTPYQVEATIHLTREIRRLCQVGAPELRKNLFEHNWLSPTSCPSGRIPWDTIIAGQEDEMTPEQMADLKKHIVDHTNVVLGAVADLKVWLDEQFKENGAERVRRLLEQNEVLKGSGNGLTFEETVEATQEASRRGTN